MSDWNQRLNNLRLLLQPYIYRGFGSYEVHLKPPPRT
ncbi:MAG: hypothetical protein RLZZ184_1145, partial [Cyanobacteriota bacterium]